MKKQTQNKNQAQVKKSKKCNSKVLNLLKSILLGPIITSLAIAILYIAWWGLSKTFYTLHNWVLTTVEPWVEGAWPYVLGIWAFVLITSLAYSMLASEKKEKNVKSNDDGDFDINDNQYKYLFQDDIDNIENEPNQ